MIGTWLRHNLSCYVGNATAMRDFRVQLRGNRAVLLWSFYLVVLIGFAMVVYNQSASGYRTSIVDAQYRLRSFYQSIMMLLAVMINLIAPALTAGAIVMERQRRSLDLVFSAPVSPKYYLVGKMISSYRYTWMLLILSLPVTSACVVLGGATWSDVISAYLILSFTALIYTSIALLLSTLAKQPVSAVIWSYIASIVYSVVSGGLIGSSFVNFGSRTMEAPFVVALNPYLVVQASPTYTDIAGHHIPNWLMGGLVSLLICKIMLLGAASALSGYKAADTKGLRIHGLIYAAFYIGLGAFAVGTAASRAVSYTSMGTPTPIVPASTPWNAGVNLAFGWMFMPLVIFLPFLTCYGRDGERKFWPDGVFSIRNIFTGTPSGGLPYVWALILAASLSMMWLLGHYSPGIALSPAMVVWVLSLWTFMWSIGRLASSFNSGLRSARTLHFTLMMLLIALPVPFFSAASTFDSSSTGIWDIYILRPLIGSRDNSSIAMVMSGVLILASALLTYVAELNAARKGLVQGQTA